MSKDGLGLTPEQFWAATPREYYALEGVWEMQWERKAQFEGTLIAKLNNMFRSATDPISTWEDIYPPRHKRRRDPNRKLADPLDPFGRQTVEEKMFMARSMLSEAANSLPEGGLLPPDAPKEMPEWQRQAIETAWADFANLTGQKPN